GPARSPRRRARRRLLGGAPDGPRSARAAVTVEAPFPDAGDEAGVVPRPAATVMLLRDRADGMEVLLLQRAASTPFVPGAHVFPGGAVDDGDADHDDIVDG